MGKVTDWDKITVEDIRWGLRVLQAGSREMEILYRAVMNSPLKKYVDEFMKVIRQLPENERNRSSVLRKWKFRGESKDKKDADWMKETLEPELERLNLIRIDGARYEVIV